MSLVVEEDFATLSEQALFHTIGQIGIVLDVLEADPSFIERLAVDPTFALAEYHVMLPPDELFWLWEKGHPSRNSRTAALYRYFLNRYQPATSRKELLCHPQDERFYAWWTARLEEVATMLPETRDKEAFLLERSYIIAFELSKGCSGNCWYCGVSAQKLEGMLDYTPKNRALWRDVLKSVRESLGSVAGVCYFATDPLDNPHYPAFCLDYWDIMGYYPQMTTALALNYPDRASRVLQESREHGQLHHRFSVQSLAALKEICARFPPHELALVSIEPQNPEAQPFKANAGRARYFVDKKPHQISSSEALIDSSICSLTGFLINMVSGTIRLISPCPASAIYPDGYVTHHEAHFTDKTSFAYAFNHILNSLSV